MDTMKETELTLRDPDKPLAIVVTHEGSEFLKLRTLAQDAIPMLLRPEAYPQPKREQIAEGFRQILEGACFDSDIESDFPEAEPFDEENEGYEPGECLVWPDEEDI